MPYPIAAYLFLLPAKILNAFIQQQPKIKGIKISGFEYKTAQFADDTSFFLDGTGPSFCATLNEIYLTKITWVRRLLTLPVTPWAFVFTYIQYIVYKQSQKNGPSFRTGIQNKIRKDVINSYLP